MEKKIITREQINTIITNYLNTSIPAVRFDGGYSLLKFLDNKVENNVFEEDKYSSIIDIIVGSIKMKNGAIDELVMNKTIYSNEKYISIPSAFINATVLNNTSHVFTIKSDISNFQDNIVSIIEALSNTNYKFHLNISRKTTGGETPFIKIYTNDEYKEQIEQVLLSLNLKTLPQEDYKVSLNNNIEYAKYINKLESLNILSKSIIDGIISSIDEFLTINNHLNIDENLINKYRENDLKYNAIQELLKYIVSLDRNFIDALIDRVMHNIMNNPDLTELYEVSNTIEQEEEEERIIKIEPPKIVHEEELVKDEPSLTEEERTNLIDESEQLNKIEKYQGLLSIDEAFEVLRPGFTVYDYLEQNNVLNLIPLDAEILLDDGITMSGIEFIKTRVIPGVKYYNQNTVIDTIQKYSTDYMNKIESERIKLGGLFRR